MGKTVLYHWSPLLFGVWGFALVSVLCFFQDLENAAGETLDYSRMNRDLSQSATTMSPEGAAKAAATLAALEDIEQEERAPMTHPKSEPITDQVTYRTIELPPLHKRSCLNQSLNSLHTNPSHIPPSKFNYMNNREIKRILCSTLPNFSHHQQRS